jgi:hypothetical protein
MTLKRHYANDFLCRRGLKSPSTVVATNVADKKYEMTESSLHTNKLTIILGGTFYTMAKTEETISEAIPISSKRRYSATWQVLFSN